jgi:hypothetical protein
MEDGFFNKEIMHSWGRERTEAQSEFTSSTTIKLKMGHAITTKKWIIGLSQNIKL